ncbi:MAG: hypothetical protein JEZ07_10985 [Phycisphaerae bacterium]|nr:hypothetical protein [Phycisphaerae bacterium]
MKDSAEYAARFKKLCTKIKKDFDAPDEFPLIEPLEALIDACLSYLTTESKAKSAMKKIRSEFVDFNELRVARHDELIMVMGKTFPQVREVIEQLTGILQSIFDKEDSLGLETLKECGKREAKAFLESLEHSNPYIVSSVMLHSIGAHAFPMHPAMFQMLRDQNVVNPKSDMADVQGFLERQISASEVHYMYAMLRHFTDHYKAETPTAKKTTKKATKKTTKKVAKKK